MPGVLPTPDVNDLNTHCGVAGREGWPFRLPQRYVSGFLEKSCKPHGVTGSRGHGEAAPSLEPTSTPLSFYYLTPAAATPDTKQRQISLIPEDVGVRKRDRYPGRSQPGQVHAAHGLLLLLPPPPPPLAAPARSRGRSKGLTPLPGSGT